MDRSESWEQGTPEHRAWTQGPWHGALADQGARSPGAGHAAPADQGPWRQGPWDSGTGFGDGAYGDWTVATVAARTLARRVRRFLLLSVFAGVRHRGWPDRAGRGGVARHGVLAVFLVLLAVPVLFVSLVTAAAVWVGRRAWRSGAWMEAVPVAAGAPWLSRVIWALRAALVGKAFWRFGRRARRSSYQARPGGLSGTTR